VHDASSIAPIKKKLKANNITLFFNVSLHFHLFAVMFRVETRKSDLQLLRHRFKATGVLLHGNRD
jgi:hypothetical protein